MCTAIIQNDPGRVVIAANRDEVLARPTTPPRRLGAIRVSGLDEKAGGTWCGATDAGFVVWVTNQRPVRPPDPARRSRGELVMTALRLGNTKLVDDLVAQTDALQYNPFNLLYGDALGLRVAYGRDESSRIEIRDVPPGLHVLPNDVLDSPAFPKVERAKRLLADHDLRATLADHEHPVDLPFGALCIHTPSYGTRSATLVELEPDRVVRYWVANGTPCTTDWAPVD